MPLNTPSFPLRFAKAIFELIACLNIDNIWLLYSSLCEEVLQRLSPLSGIYFLEELSCPLGLVACEKEKTSLASMSTNPSRSLKVTQGGSRSLLITVSSFL